MPEYLEELLKQAKELKAGAGKPAAKPGVPQEEVEAEVAGEKTLITSYGNVKIFRVEGEPLPVYAIPITKPSGPEKVLINTVKEAATRLIMVSPEDIRDPQRRRDYYFRRIKEIITASPELGVPPAKIDFYADMVVREMIGYGLIDSLTKDERLEEIMVIAPERPVYVFHRDYDMLKTNVVFGTDEEVINLISRIARDVGRRVDTSNPLLDARLPDGSRVNATIRPISAEGATLTIRKFRADPFTIVDLFKFGTLCPEMAAFFWLAVDGLSAHPANILIVGGAGCGKTTLLNCFASFIPPRERIITIEDTLELNLPIEHLVKFETRPPGLEGIGEVTMDMLLKNTLRMRPDRIIVGEVRHAEAFTMFSALNTGHKGSLGTIHANSAQETITRLLSPPMSVPAIMLNALNFVVVEQRLFDRRKGTLRRINEVSELIRMDENKASMQTVFEWEPATDTFKKLPVSLKYLKELENYTGMASDEIEAEIENRVKFLEDLTARGVRQINEVLIEFRKYSAKYGKK